MGVEVLEPEELRDAVIETAEAMTKIYAKNRKR
jgi:predicted DNA-binding transcriptional regulator YafY